MKYGFSQRAETLKAAKETEDVCVFSRKAICFFLLLSLSCILSSCGMAERVSVPTAGSISRDWQSKEPSILRKRNGRGGTSASNGSNIQPEGNFPLQIEDGTDNVDGAKTEMTIGALEKSMRAGGYKGRISPRESGADINVGESQPDNFDGNDQEAVRAESGDAGNELDVADNYVNGSIGAGQNDGWVKYGYDLDAKTLGREIADKAADRFPNYKYLPDIGGDFGEGVTEQDVADPGATEQGTADPDVAEQGATEADVEEQDTAEADASEQDAPEADASEQGTAEQVVSGDGSEGESDEGSNAVSEENQDGEVSEESSKETTGENQEGEASEEGAEETSEEGAEEASEDNSEETSGENFGETNGENSAEAGGESAAEAAADDSEEETGYSVEGEEGDAAEEAKDYPERPGTQKPGSISVELSNFYKVSPFLMVYDDEFTLARHLWDCLVKLDADGEIIPGAAESWECSPDGMKWIFHLRRNAKWVDSKGGDLGSVTAEDFVFSWTQLMNPNIASEHYDFAALFKNGEKYYNYVTGQSTKEVLPEELGFRAVGRYTLEVELEKPVPNLLEYLAFEVMAPVYKAFYEQIGAAKFGLGAASMAYNGAWYLAEWNAGQRAVMRKNPLWWNAENVETEEIIFDRYQDEESKARGFLGNALDIMSIAPGEFAAYNESVGRVSSYLDGYSCFLWTNTSDNSDFRSANLRRAVEAAIDRRDIIDTVFQNDNEIPKGFAAGFSGVSGGSFSDAVLEAQGGGSLYGERADLEKANEYLQKAMGDLGYAEPSAIMVRLIAKEGMQEALLLEKLALYLREGLGLTVQTEVLPITEWRSRRNSFDFDLCLGSWQPQCDDPENCLVLLESGNVNNYAAYSDFSYDALLEYARRAGSRKEREKYLASAELKIAETLPVIPLYWRRTDYVFSDKIEAGCIRRAFQPYNLTYVRLKEQDGDGDAE